MPRNFLIWGLFVPLLFFAKPIMAETFFGEVSTGLMELDEFRYPVYLFVPENYQISGSYPLVMAVPGEEESAEDMIEDWSKAAKKKNWIVVVPNLPSLRSGELPYDNDEWFLNLKNTLQGRYSIAPTKVFLIGSGGAAHYAAYLGLQYPEEFSSVGLLGGSWVGPFEKITRMSKRPRKQLPFFVSMKEQNVSLMKRTEVKAYQLTKKGYPVYLEKLNSEESYSSQDVRERMMSWMQEKAQVWAEVIREHEKKLKEKVIRGVEELAAPPN